MSYLIGQILLCLVLAALLGFIIGWFARASRCARELEALRAELSRAEVAPAAAVPRQSDDLKRIEGIGPKIEELLAAGGIDSFAKLAEARPEALRAMLVRAGDRFRMHDPSSWPDQARLAVEGRWVELEEYQDLLVGGRTGAPPQTPGDDLKRIEGIGPKIEHLLKSAGIETWAQLAAADADTLREILARAGERYRIHDSKSWPDQARLAADGRWEELSEFQDVLLGGRES
jgi:predicted flap endonuclease-1-like 5' DNA nuclease